MKAFVKAAPSLAKINAMRLSMGLDTLDANPAVMRPGKTAKANRKAQDANKAARAQANREMKNNRAKRK